MTKKRTYQRHLPHQIPEGFPIFLTWNLKGAMPEPVFEKLRQERKRLEKQAPRAGETAAEKTIREHKVMFAMADRFLDHTMDLCT